MSNSIADAIDNIAEEFPGGGSAKSRSITEALDRIRKVVAGCCSGSIDYSHLAIGPSEQVLVFGSVDTIALKDANLPGKGYFSSQGQLTDLCGRFLPGTVCQSALPIDPSILPGTVAWPNAQAAPFDNLPVDNTNVVVPVIAGNPTVGYAKCFTDFGHGDTIVTVGPSTPKIALTSDGGAQFWVSLCMAMSQGTGKYAGAKGEQAFVGSAYFPKWPAKPPDQVALLSAGFKVKLVRCIKVVLKADLAP